MMLFSYLYRTILSDNGNKTLRELRENLAFRRRNQLKNWLDSTNSTRPYRLGNKLD